MDEISNQNYRRTTRWDGYDYTACGAYFVTICAFEKRCAFGRVLDGAMRLNVYGEMVQQMWEEISLHYPHIVPDTFQIMPNHVHGIIIITNVGAGFPRPNDGSQPHESQPNESQPNDALAPTRAGKPRPYVPTLGQIVGYFKYQATKRINAHRTENDLPIVRVWQRNYHDRVIRDEKELNHTRRYIIENPMNWANDENYPQP